MELLLSNNVIVANLTSIGFPDLEYSEERTYSVQKSSVVIHHDWQHGGEAAKEPDTSD